MAIKRWLGNAAAVTDLWTISLSGTVTSQTYSMTINGKSVTYTASGSDSVATVLTSLATAWNASALPEFQELTAANGTTTMTLTQDTPGIPSTIAVATNGAATFSIANTTAATGPNFFDNVQNWSGGAPTNGDTLIFDQGSAGCNYNINTALTTVTFQVKRGYTGTIGLPFINANGQTPYNEYRTTSLTLAGGTAIIDCPTLKQCNLAFGSNTTTVRVLSTSTQRLSQYIPVVLIQGGNSLSVLDVTQGDVGIANYLGQTANFPTIATGFATNSLTDVNLYCGPGCILGTVTKNGGVAVISANITTLTQDIGGGTVTLTDAVTATTVNVYAGTVNLNTTGTVGTINLYGSATLSADGDPRAKTITNNINVNATTVTVTDNQKSINSGTLSLNTNGVTSCNIAHGGNTTIVLT